METNTVILITGFFICLSIFLLSVFMKNAHKEYDDRKFENDNRRVRYYVENLPEIVTKDVPKRKYNKRKPKRKKILTESVVIQKRPVGRPRKTV